MNNNPCFIGDIENNVITSNDVIEAHIISPKKKLPLTTQELNEQNEKNEKRVSALLCLLMSLTLSIIFGVFFYRSHKHIYIVFSILLFSPTLMYLCYLLNKLCNKCSFGKKLCNFLCD